MMLTSNVSRRSVTVLSMSTTTVATVLPMIASRPLKHGRQFVVVRTALRFAIVGYAQLSMATTMATIATAATMATTMATTAQRVERLVTNDGFLLCYAVCVLPDRPPAWGP
jgi:hypothetical protein